MVCPAGHTGVEMTTDPFPPGFFDRTDPTDDAAFYAQPRFVTHIDDAAIAAVGDLYAELGITGRVVDLASSWISHFREPPQELIGVGLNAAELAANPALTESHVVDLNADPHLPLADGSVDHVVCCVSVDYLVRPIEVFADVARVLRPGGLFVNAFSNRCFPTKAIHGWLQTGDREHVAIVARYYELAGAFEPARAELRTPAGRGDPLYGVWAAHAPGRRPACDS